jgi:hypothetical protein
MKITARIPRENPRLVETLKSRGLEAKVVRSATIVALPEEGGVYTLPAEVQGAGLLLEAEETGGGQTHTGKATVVCDLSGKPLRPYYVPTTGHLAGGTHAYFATPGTAVTVTAYRDGEITVERHSILADGNTARIESAVLWQGQVGDLPETFGGYADAAEAAYRKAGCYHCRHVHYAV